MKIPGIVAVMVLSAASMWAQAATQAPAAPAAQTSTDAAKPADHAKCMRGKSAKMGSKKACHCMKNKGGMAKDMDGNMKGKCPRMKKDSESKS